MIESAELLLPPSACHPVQVGAALTKHAWQPRVWQPRLRRTHRRRVGLRAVAPVDARLPERRGEPAHAARDGGCQEGTARAALHGSHEGKRVVCEEGIGEEVPVHADAPAVRQDAAHRRLTLRLVPIRCPCLLLSRGRGASQTAARRRKHVRVSECS